MSQYNEAWEKIIKVHQYAKNLSLKAEEFESDFQTFLQPSKEQRDSCEHIIRAMAGKLNLRHEPSDEQYVLGNLNKALGHEYRAFFDTADWLSIAIREKIQDMLEPYNNACLTSVIPGYYTKIRPRIDDISFGIAEIRDSKDIAASTDILSLVEEYNDKIQLLFDDYKTLMRHIPSLETYRQKDKKSVQKAMLWKIIIGVAVGVMIAIISSVATQLSCQPNQNIIPPTSTTKSVSP